ncbi:hypothetical protein PS645_02777 [Pseudomonas fluorescens]|uniref:RING-type E3 ubiquitin transferase n=1 Tax=Pseudomonas fluorescens TaxID=294 RepID=A0A5E6TJC9_PSEFL|nr:DUF6543 domain-containing protein [Pseudomonas fluorescens]VVM90993.1 hypothetical protein PS645_02777 [Pseudomonas fluorescens]
MSDLQGSNPANVSSATEVAEVGESVHQHRINKVIPEAIKKASPATLKSMLTLNAKTPDWYSSAVAEERQQLKALIDEHWRLQAELDGALVDLQSDIETFAKPLLATAMQAQFGAAHDPQALSLHLYVPDTIIFGLDTGASRIRQSSLLAAALHNFEDAETRAGAFREGSGILRKDLQGRPQRIDTLTPEKFASLCRTLDIGGQYQNHIKALLQPKDATAALALKARSIASEKSAFRLAALTARLKGDVSAAAYDRLTRVVEGQQATLDGRPLLNHRLSLMGFKMTGIVLFSAVSEPSEIKKAVDALTPASLKFWLDWSRRIPALSGNAYEHYKLIQNFFANGPQGVVDEALRKEDIYNQSRLNGPLIAYIPDDPQHPLKEYASLSDFMSTLLTQLRTPQYQEFFSRFVDQQDKGKFFARANERLTAITWHPREPLDMGPWWRETAIENPNAEPVTNVIKDELWDVLFRQRRDKAIADARKIAVPTGDEDAITRWRRLTSVLDIAWNVFNFGAMLVPGLGEAVLGVMVGQMLAELAEGIEDWSKGDKEQASAHLTGVLINFAQLALMSAGHLLPAQVMPVKTSPFLEQLKPVLVNGEERLWNPDLSAYEHPATLPQKARTSEWGLYQHEGQDFLPLDGKNFAVSRDADTGLHRLQHPTRPEAYRPVAEHNGAGVWRTELDQPLIWDKPRLLSRFGISAQGLPAQQLEHVLTVAGISEDALRRLHVELDPHPVMLTDTLKRFGLYAEAGLAAEQILLDQVSEALVEDIAGLMTELPHWPELRSVEIYEGTQLTGPSVLIGNSDAALANRIRLTRAELRDGQLPQQTIATLSEQEIHELLGHAISSQKDVRVQALKETLANAATKKRKQLFESLYKQHEVAGGSNVQLLSDAYPDLPNSVAERLLQQARPEDLRHLAEKQSVPLRLREQARTAQQRVRLSRAYEGLYLDELANNDTRRLELASLANLAGWSDDIRIEIREYSYDGKLNASVGPQDASLRKVLILEEEGTYLARDEDNQHLHGSDDFFASLLRALPDQERRALGYDIFEGARLRSDLQRTPLDHEQFASILHEHPNRKPAYDPETMRLLGGMQGYRRLADRPTLQRRLRSLYPEFSNEQIATVYRGLGDAAPLRISELEAEFNQMNTTLQRWMNSPTVAQRFSPAGVAEWTSRDRLYKALRQCWQRTGPLGPSVPGVIRLQLLDLSGFPMSRHLANFPTLTANFDHVTSLSMRNANVLSSQGQFVELFRGLRSLDLGENVLTRLPPVIGNLRQLEQLLLDNNQIALTPQAVARLRSLTRLEALSLQGNPLGLVPDISQMPNLELINLESTGIDRWPTGLFATPRPRHIHLNLRRNPLVIIPEVAPGSFRAELLARTIVSREPEWMPADVLERLKQYTESVGLDPERPYPSLGIQDSINWSQGMSESVFMDRLIIWDEVEDEFGSEPFFNEIRRLTQSADFSNPELTYRTELTEKVWRMLEAMHEDTALRELIFNQAALPTACSDGGTELFNALGVQVLVHEAYALENPALVEAEMVELARGKSRLNEIGAIARGHVAERLRNGERFRVVGPAGSVTGTIDEVEDHLAFMTELAEPLDLPWQSRGMLFRAFADRKINATVIEAARVRVLELEKGNLLVERILEQPFWQNYLEKTYADEIQNLKDMMQDEDELAQFNAIENLKRVVTEQAIERAKLRRTEPPLNLQPAR